MLKHYLTVSLRNLLRQKGYTAINVAGLAIGMSCVLLVAMLVRDELSYDRFHERADRLYRVTWEANVGTKEYLSAQSSAPLAQALQSTVPEVERASRIFYLGDHTYRVENQAFNEYTNFLADSNLFRMMSFDVLEGDPQTFLTRPNTIVLSDVAARRFFGSAPALGRVIMVDETHPFEVCGVVRRLPPQSHWHFDYLLSSFYRPAIQEGNWVGNDLTTYVLLREGASPEQVEATFQPITSAHVRPVLAQIFGADFSSMETRGMYYRYKLQPITAIHLFSRLDGEFEPTGAITYVTLFLIIGGFILAIACINFTNLATARSARRAKEVGVRKVLGAQREQLITLFLTESFLQTLIALIISAAIIELVLPEFNAFFHKALSFADLGPTMLVGGGLLVLVVMGLLAGTYPALVLSAFAPAQVLKGSLRSGMKSGRLRKILVVTQFAISIALIIGTLVVNRQLQYVQSTDLGFDKDRLLVVDNTWRLGERAGSFKQALLQLPGVDAAGFTQNLPGKDIESSGAYRAEGADRDNLLMFRQLFCGFDYLPTIGVRIREGRNFSSSFPTDSTEAVIINATAARTLGYEHPIGRKVIGFFGPNERSLTIVGVTEDFHYEDLHQRVQPMVILPSRGLPTRVVLRVHGDVQKAREAVMRQWDTFSGGQPTSCFYLDSRIEGFYQRDRLVATLFAVLAGLGIAISCLGLLGLAMYATEQRTKELGVRKVLGATIPNLLGLLTREFVQLVLIANVIAWPAAYFAMQRWLENFAYRIALDLGTFLLAGGMALVVALVTVAYHTIRAAVADPVESLRYE